MKIPDVAAASLSSDAILDNLAQGVFAVDQQRRIIFFNSAAEAITGLPRWRVLGRPCAAVFKSASCQDNCPLSRSASPRTTLERRIVLARPSGKQVAIGLGTTLLRDSSGGVIGAVETVRALAPAENPAIAEEDRLDFVACGARIRPIIDSLPQVAASDATVLLQGETGTGKEVLARSIHHLSSRRDGPFVAVNCAALPDTLLESELFGYKAGAFTGAIKDKPGRFALAEGGTIFLDEIGDISPNLQIRLLRVLQERSYEPLGGAKSVPANVRVIVASNRDLATLMEEGRFRQDLYYRVNVVRLDLPPLRDRRDEIPALIDHFVARFNRLQGRAVTGVSEAALAKLVSHDYPGNIRELENIIERAFVFCPNSLIDASHLPETLVSLALPEKPSTLYGAVREIEKEALLQALTRQNYNRKAAARELGMHKSTFFKKVKTLGIRLPQRDGRSARKGRNKGYAVA